MNTVITVLVVIVLVVLAWILVDRLVEFDGPDNDKGASVISTRL